MGEDCANEPRSLFDLVSEDIPDAERAVTEATKKPRMELILDILGHPANRPTHDELAYLNPNKTEDEIRDHLKVLIKVGVVEERCLKTKEQRDDYPTSCYALTPAVMELFEAHEAIDVDAWKRQYESVEKTDRIKEIESIPRQEP